MNILICDDSPDNAEELVHLLRHSGLKMHMTVFHSGADALGYYIAHGRIDLCFLDIMMPDMTGVALAKELRMHGYAGEIIFLSASREYAPESYEVKAFSYLLKPPAAERVNAVLNELYEMRKKRDTGSILLKISGGVKSVLLRDISYVEVIRNAVYFRLQDGSEIAVYTTFGEIAATLLQDPRFVQCHRSYLVNMEDILEIAKNEIIMNGGARIAISRTFSDAKDKYFRWVFGSDCQ